MQESNNVLYRAYEDILGANLSVHEASELYTYQISNEHDTIFKDLFSDREEARKFLNQYLNLKIPIKENELEPYNNSFITPDFRNKEADIVYKMKNRNIFFLIEHQSTIDLSMPYRIENYSMLIINRAVEKEKMRQKGYLYPKVIPIVLYTGEKKWKTSLSFSEVQEKLDGYEETDKSYAIVDINNYTEKELLEDDLTISKVLMIEKSRTDKNFIANIEKVVERTNTDKLYVIEKIINLILRKELGNKKTDMLLEKFKNKKEGKNMLLVAERLKKDREREMKRCQKEGMEKGIQKTKLITAKKMLEEGLDIDLINKITGLSKEKIEEFIQ